MSSNRVTGARLKAAALVHSRKQLMAIGAVRPTATNVGNATFSGDTAFACWELYEDRVSSYRINYPAMPDNALVTRREADLIAAYTLHECGHIAYTCNKSTSGLTSARFALWNGIEDARIERAMIASGNARGARSGFKKLMSKFTVGLDAQGFNPASINSAPLALALVCRAAYGDGNGYAKTLLDRIPEPKRALYQRVVDAMPGLSLGREGSAQVRDLAEQFINDWLAIEPKAFEVPQGFPMPQPQGNQGEQGEGEQTAQPFNDNDAPSQAEGDDDNYDLDFNSDANSDGESVDDDLDISSDAVKGFKLDDDEDDDDAIDVTSDMQDALEDEPVTLGAGAGGLGGDFSEDTVTEDDGLPSDVDPFSDVTETYDDSKAFKAEPNVDDVFEAISKRTKNGVSLATFQPARRSNMRLWKSMAEVDDVKQRRDFRKLHKSALPALKAQLFRILRAPERNGWDGGALGGRFDGKRAPRMLAGSECVFKRRWVEDGIDTAVSVIVDLSGSMKGETIKQSVDLAWTIAEAAESARAKVEVVGFSDAVGGYGIAGSGYDMTGEWKGGGNSSTYPSTLCVAKRFQDSCANSASQFAMMKRIAAGSTPDYGAVRSVCEQMSAMPQARKLVIVVTDGFGDMNNMLELTKASYDLYGVDVIGFGIGCWAGQFARAYSFGAVVNDLTDLHSTVLKSVIKQLDARDTRRAA